MLATKRSSCGATLLQVSFVAMTAVRSSASKSVFNHGLLTSTHVTEETPDRFILLYKRTRQSSNVWRMHAKMSLMVASPECLLAVNFKISSKRVSRTLLPTRCIFVVHLHKPKYSSWEGKGQPRTHAPHTHTHLLEGGGGGDGGLLTTLVRSLHAFGMDDPRRSCATI